MSHVRCDGRPSRSGRRPSLSFHLQAIPTKLYTKEAYQHYDAKYEEGDAVSSRHVATLKTPFGEKAHMCHLASRTGGGTQTGHTAAPGARKTAVLFPGQGAQVLVTQRTNVYCANFFQLQLLILHLSMLGMGADIYENFKAARDVIDASDEAVGGGLKKLMFEGPQQTLTSTENAQPALLKVLETEFGFDINSCTYALGHSLGEYSALVATQSLSLSDAIKLVVSVYTHVPQDVGIYLIGSGSSSIQRLRGEAMHRSVDNGKTTMKALIINGDHLEDIEVLMSKIERSLPEGEVAQIANINSRSQVVLSGTSKGVDYACSIIQTKGYAGRALGLPVSAPFHCNLMQPAADEMKTALDGASFNDPSIEVISNVTGMPLVSAGEIQSLLHQQITKTVQWQRSIRYAKDDDVHDWVVIGPSRVLANLLRKEFPTDAIRAVATAEDVQQHGPHLCRKKR
ncbi:hypothetical protein SpCBS45565_g02911 [Spizellomyces sp. 'palustris']|nr:hypothetical protein SpCBS45565_g02911 [Spizellomyces sp. 'palustris']